MNELIETMIRESNLIERVRGAEALQDSYRAWKWLTEQPPRPTLATIKTVHWLITERLMPPGERGVIRKEDVMIGGHVAMSPLALYSALEDWLHQWQGTDPRASHITFEKIHPFIDGNGRTGRMFYYWQLWQLKDLSLKTIIYDKKKQAYYDWFKAPKSDSGDLTPKA